MTATHIRRRIPCEMPAMSTTNPTPPALSAAEAATPIAPAQPTATPTRRLGPAALALATAGAALMALWRLQTASPLWTVAWLAVAAVALFALVATWEPVRDAELEADDLDW